MSFLDAATVLTGWLLWPGALTYDFDSNISGVLSRRIPHDDGVHALVLPLRPLNGEDAVALCGLHVDTPVRL